MNLFQQNETEGYHKRRLRVFEKSWLLQEKLQYISRFVGSVDTLSVLDIGSLGGILGYFSRQKCPHWACGDFSPEGVLQIERLAGDPVALMDELDWPFEGQQFDVVIISDRLKKSSQPRGMIAQAHKVLKDNGMLVVVTGKSPGKGKSSDYYSEQELFEVIRDGFDVMESTSFNKALSSRLQRFMDHKLALIGSSWDDICEDEKKTDVAYGFLSRLYPVCWLAARLDALMVFSKGHSQIVKARRRRVWRSRAAPQLRDGRSIADAALNTKIGSAADF